MAKRITLLDLIDAGLLEDGEPLECRFRKNGDVYVGELNADGSIPYDSEDFDSPSAWALHLKRKKNPNRKGWKCVWARGKTLSEYKKSLPSQTEPTKAHKQPPESDSNAETSSFVPEESKATPDTFVAKREDNTDLALLERIAELSPSGFEKLVASS